MAVDIYTPEGRVRYNLGDTEKPYVLDEIAIVFSLNHYSSLPEAERIWNATYDCFKYLLAKLANTTSTGRREKEGNVEIEEYGSSKYAQVKQAYEDFIKTPIGTTSAYGSVIFGGVSKKEKCRVYNNPDGVQMPFQQGWTLSED